MVAVIMTTLRLLWETPACGCWYEAGVTDFRCTCVSCVSAMAEMLSAHSRVRFYQAGASEGSRAHTRHGDASDAGVCLRVVVSFQRQRRTSDRYGN